MKILFDIDEDSMSLWFYTKDRLRRVRPMLTRLRRGLYAFSIARERLLDLDKEYGMKRWCTRRDKFLDFNPNSRLQQDGRLSRTLCTFLVDVGD